MALYFSEAGTYYVLVSDQRGRFNDEPHGNSDYTYELSVRTVTYEPENLSAPFVERPVRTEPAGAVRIFTTSLMQADRVRLQLTTQLARTFGTGVDPIIVAAQVMTALQMIPSRQLDVTTAPAVISIGSIHGGVRGNIIPASVKMEGTIRTFDPNMREELLERVRNTAERVAEAAGAEAIVKFLPYAPVTFNDPELTTRMVPTLDWAAGESNLVVGSRVMASEDFSFFQEKIPGLYFSLGVNKPGVAPGEAAPNHSPYFYVNDDALIVGVRAMVGLAMDYLGAR